METDKQVGKSDGVHIRCTYVVYIYGVHTSCTYKVYIRSVHTKCTRGTYSRSVRVWRYTFIVQIYNVPIWYMYTQYTHGVGNQEAGKSCIDSWVSKLCLLSLNEKEKYTLYRKILRTQVISVIIDTSTSE